MQPYFFPYLGYISLIKHTDEFVLFDSAQFIRHGWIDRNRILKPGGGWHYIRVPLKKRSQTTPIKDVLIDESRPWREQLKAQLEAYRPIAPHYRAVRELVCGVVDRRCGDLVTLNKTGLEAVCEYLGFPRRLPVLSTMGLTVKPPAAADEWALHICQALGDVAEYRNPPGGKGLFDATKYERAGIRLRFQRVELAAYPQGGGPFEPGLSIIDVLMFNAPETVNAMLDVYELG